jgi:hypothetical protein
MDLVLGREGGREMKSRYYGWLWYKFREKTGWKKEGPMAGGVKMADVAYCNLNKFKTA